MDYKIDKYSDNNITPVEYERKQHEEFQSFEMKIRGQKETLEAELSKIKANEAKYHPSGCLTAGLPLIVILGILVNMTASGRPTEMLTAAICVAAITGLYWLFRAGKSQSNKSRSAEINNQIESLNKQVADEQQLMFDRIQKQNRLYREAEKRRAQLRQKAIEEVQQLLDEFKCYELNIIPFLTALNDQINGTRNILGNCIDSVKRNEAQLRIRAAEINGRAERLNYDNKARIHII